MGSSIGALVGALRSARPFSMRVPRALAAAAAASPQLRFAPRTRAGMDALLELQSAHKAALLEQMRLREVGLASIVPPRSRSHFRAGAMPACGCGVSSLGPRPPTHPHSVPLNFGLRLSASGTVLVRRRSIRRGRSQSRPRPALLSVPRRASPERSGPGQCRSEPAGPGQCRAVRRAPRRSSRRRSSSSRSAPLQQRGTALGRLLGHRGYGTGPLGSAPILDMYRELPMIDLYR